MPVSPEMPALAGILICFWYVCRHMFTFYIIRYKTPRQKYVIPPLPVKTQCGYNVPSFSIEKRSSLRQNILQQDI